MNMFKKTGGFTLVELIVVIAILAILAGVAVPAYSGYIERAEQAGDLQILSSVNTAAQGLAVAEGAEVTGITVTKTANDVTIEVKVTNAEGTENDTSVVTATDVETLTGELKPADFSTKFSTGVWASGEWKINPAT